MRLVWTILFAACGFAALGQAQTEASKNQQAVPAQQPQAAQPDQAGASAPAKDRAEPAVAHVLVYRQRRFTGSALAPSVYIDDKQVARIGNGRRVSIRLLPGSHTVRSDDKSSAIAVEAKAGQDYYVRIDEETGFWKGHGKLTMVMPEQGSAEYKLQKPVEEDRRIAKELIEPDSEVAEKKAEPKQENK
jgi:hypothetical protein